MAACDICGSNANGDKIMTCFNCRVTREHIYCAKVLLKAVPAMWLCEVCRTSSRVLSIKCDEKKEACDVCGSNANDDKIMTCFNCRVTREHIYCAKVMLKAVPAMWLCEVCRTSRRVLRIEPIVDKDNQI